MKDNNININDLFSLTARQAEVIKRVKNGGLSISDALSQTQAILDGKLPPKEDKFYQYAKYLLPLSAQAQRLRELNKRMPLTMRVPDSWFSNLDTTSDHVQMIEDLEFFFIVPRGPLKKVINYQVKLVELSQPNVVRTDDFDNELKGSYLDETANADMYKMPGIYRIRINLASYWDPNKAANSMDHARMVMGIVDHATPAGVAAVGAYAAQNPQLYSSMDGHNLPYFGMADIRTSVDGSTFYSNFRGGSWQNGVRFISSLTCFTDLKYAYPTIVE